MNAIAPAPQSFLLVIQTQPRAYARAVPRVGIDALKDLRRQFIARMQETYEAGRLTPALDAGGIRVLMSIDAHHLNRRDPIALEMHRPLALRDLDAFEIEWCTAKLDQQQRPQT